MKLLDDIYVYPWLSTGANNCNTVFIDGPVPALIDPGHLKLMDHVVQGMTGDGRDIGKVRLVIGTHSHPDHIEAAASFGEGTMQAIGLEESLFLNNGGKDLYLMTGCEMPKGPFAFFLKEGTFEIGGKAFQVLLTPGHSPGSICLYLEDEKLLISGDTLFYMGVGRTDLPGGDARALAQSIRRLSSLEIEYLVPGHGEIIKGREMVERNFNAILGGFF